MPKRRYLDNVTSLASAINPELANVVLPEQGTIRADNRSWRRRATDELAGSVKQQLAGNIPVSPWLAYPAAGAIASTLLNPITSASMLAKGALLGEVVNEANKQLTGKSFGETTGNLLDINPEVAEYLNPGYLAAGKTGRFDDLLDRGFDRLLQRQVFDLPVIDNFARNVSKTQLSLGNRNILSLGNKNILGLSYSPIRQTTNYGNVVTLPSSNRTISLSDVTVDNRRNLLKRINKIFATRYGYDPIPLKASQTRQDTENAIKQLMTQHNTFVRGVRDETEHIAETNAKLIASGLEPTLENRLKWYATRFAGDTGHGRVGFNSRNDKNLGTIYTSNMFPVAKGYASRRSPGQQGAAIVVRRPLDFSSSNLEDWVTNNEFQFVGMGGTKAGNNYFKYDLPQYLKTGRTLTRQYLDENPIIDSESYNTISNKIAENYFGNLSSENLTLYRRNTLKRFADRDNIDFEFPTTYYGPNHTAAAYAEIEDNIINALRSRYIHRQAYDKMIKDFFAKHPGYYSPEYYVGGNDRVVFKDGDRTGHMITDPSGFIFDEPDFSHPDYNKELSDELNTFLKDSRGKYMTDMVRGRYYGQLKNLKGFVQKSKDRLKKSIGRAISKEIARKQDYIDLDSYARTKGIVPTTPRTVLFGDRTGKNVTRNSKDNPWQHFVFVGPVDQQGLDYVRTIPWDELLPYPNMRGNHIGAYTPGLSRKVKAFGGSVPRRMLATGGSIHIKPENRCKFTATMKRTGKSAEELSHSKNPLTRKRAIFALNARKWKH